MLHTVYRTEGNPAHARIRVLINLSPKLWRDRNTQFDITKTKVLSVASVFEGLRDIAWLGVTHGFFLPSAYSLSFSLKKEPKTQASKSESAVGLTSGLL